ncbi:MAG: hypothetical protein ABIM50_06265 [Novosphingobium sp.]
MTNTPPTFGTDPALHSQIDWNEFATLHRHDDGGGVLYALKAMRSGSLGELVRQVQSLPEAQRKDYVIEKTGDHRLDFVEIAGLANRPDFPRT